MEQELHELVKEIEVVAIELRELNKGIKALVGLYTIQMEPVIEARTLKKANEDAMKRSLDRSGYHWSRDF